MSEIYMALLSVSPTQVGIAYQLLSYWESFAGGLDLKGYNLEGSKNSGEGHSLHIAGGGIRGSSTGPQGGAGHWICRVVHWICRFNRRFQFETTWSASINILLAAA